jgi:predicted O-linked N-acetylglucosamine transferase (SPINDLY family)
MPQSWIALGERAFPADRPAAAAPPVLTNGYVTFGTANNPVKYTRACLAAWARVVAAVPGSRFLFVRPEASSKAFKANIAAAFAAHGVAADRLDFAPVRGAHLPWYDRMDISLDTFPQTGGTTTCESLWMGVPVVSLRGEAIFERLSHSILTNAGLPDLSVDTAPAYVAAAVALAADVPRLSRLRATLRAALAASPLGQTEAFARDFFALLESAA